MHRWNWVSKAIIAASGAASGWIYKLNGRNCAPLVIRELLEYISLPEATESRIYNILGVR
jgi:hypothetical protein